MDRYASLLVSIVLLIAASAGCGGSSAEEAPQQSAPLPPEVCNGRDDDGDGRPDDGLACVAGTTRACATMCGTSGIERCSDACEWQPCVPPQEVCGNGTDDDCDGVADVTVRIGENVKLADGRWGTVAGAPDGYVLGRFEPGDGRPGMQERELVVARFDTSGRALGSADHTGFRAVFGWDEPDLAMARGGGVLAFAWAYPPRTGQFLVLAEGVSSEPRRATFVVDALDFTTLPPSLLWSGREFLVTYAFRPSGFANLTMHPFGVDGRAIGGSVAITEPGTYHWDPDVAVAGESFGVVWHQDQGSETAPDIYFARATHEHGRIGAIVRVTRPDEGSFEVVANRMPTIAYDGEGFGIAWSRGPHDQGQIHFARVTGDGQRIGSIQRVATSRFDASDPALVFTGSEYGLAWLDWNARRDVGRVLFVRLRSDGRTLGTPVVLTEAAVRDAPELVWTGNDYGVVFSEVIGENATVELARIGCE